MSNWLNGFPRKSFNTYGVVLLALFVLFSVVVIAFSASFSFNTSIHCYDRTIFKTKNILQKIDINLRCSVKYQEKFQTNFNFGLVISNFGIVFIFSIIYGYLVEHRVDKFDCLTRTSTTKRTTKDDEKEMEMISLDHEQNPKFSTFFIYVVHLIVARIVPLLIFAIVFSRVRIPDNFSCPLSMDLDLEQTTSCNSSASLNSDQNVTTIGCTNPVGVKTKSLLDIVAGVDSFVGLLTILELFYIARLARNDINFITDEVFCTVYLLRKRKIIRKVKWREINYKPESEMEYPIQETEKPLARKT